MECVFCKIIKGQIPANKAFENEKVLGFHDIAPMAKTHVLFISKIHSHDISEMVKNDLDSVTEVFKAATLWADENGLKEKGYRITTNLGKHGGQSVFHTHFHLLGGEQLKGFGA